ncbi:MAG: putative ABC transporter ATP-binding protein YlmA [Deltaproteobacteria bacterium]|nr:putative ABC transporter ATP-binding protein YlmA [Deltaproteobacteria bacterium]
MLTLNNVSNRLWDKPILKNINWTTKHGQSWAIIGPNGAGKSTLAKVILGQLPYFGLIRRDEKITNFCEIAYVSLEQQKALVAREEKKDRYEEYSGNEEHFMTGSELMDPEGKHTKALLNIAEHFGLTSLLDNPLRYYSNGETRKTLIGKALLSNPKLLILDEPFDGLDTKSVKWLKQAISGLINDGLAVLLISHRIEELVPEISHVLCLKSGKVFAQGKRTKVLTPHKMELLFGNKKIKKKDEQNLFLSTDVHGRNLQEKILIKDQDAIIRMINVNVRYGKKTVLKDFNWNVFTGENWKIVGPNGAGKSTLLSLITADNLQAYSNEIYLFGKQRGTGESIWDIKRQIGHVSSEFQVHYRESVSVLKVVLSGFFDTIGLYQAATESQKETAQNWMKFLEIDNLAEIDFTRLSYGQQRLVLIARAIVKSPALLILDEPCQGLDRANRNRVLSIIDQIGLKTETQIIYVTHVEADELNCLHHVLNFVATPSGIFRAVYS